MGYEGMRYIILEHQLRKCFPKREDLDPAKHEVGKR
jgi:hypothetical protein